MKKILSFFFLFIFTIIGSSLHAQQAGANDPTFNSTDLGFGNGDAANNTVLTTALQADGKILIGGNFTNYNGTTGINRIVRLNSDGTLDASFNPGTGTSHTVKTIVIQPDGKIIIGGSFITYNGISCNRLARLNTDGTLDATFSIGTGPNFEVNAIALQPDGKIIIGGTFNSYNGTSRIRIARLNSDGSLDTNFHPGTGLTGPVNCIAIQPNGYIIVGGGFTTINGTTRNRVGRFEPDGSLDNTFNPGTGSNNTVSTVALQPDGKVIIGGYFTTYNGTTRNSIARLNSNGSLDTGFNPAGVAVATYSSVKAVALQADGKIVIGGGFTDLSRYHIARLNSNGSLDTGFNPIPDFPVETITLQSNGKIIFGGDFDFVVSNPYRYTRHRIARLNTDGSIDSGFNSGSGANNVIYASVVQPDGKVMIGGKFMAYNGTPRQYFTRANTDGSLDNTFTSKGVDTDVYGLSVQPDGKILLVGDFYSYGGGGSPSNSSHKIIRLNTDGSFDNSLNVGSGANYSINSVKVQPNGKILIGGVFTTYNGTSRKKIARINATGSLDNTFVPATAFIGNGTVQTIAIQADGKILLGGTFTGTSQNRIIRMNSDGSMDANFNSGTGANDVINSIEIQTDGKIIIGGNFTAYNGITRNGIARLNIDGSLDATFNPGTGTNGFVNAIAILPNGKIVIGGQFTSYNGISRNNITRLNNDGSIDSGFGGIGTNGSVNTISLQADGNIIIGGSFTSYDGVGRNRIARIIGGGSSFISTSPLSAVTYCVGNQINIPFTAFGTFDPTNIFTAQLSDATGSFTNPIAIGTLSSSNPGTIAATIPASQTAGTGFRVRVVSSNPVLIGSDNGANLTINLLPAATINGPASVCNNATGSVVTFTGSGSSGPFTFTYNINGGTSQTVTTTTGNSVTIPINTSTAGSLNYNLVSVSTAGGCSQTQTATATVIINNNIVISGTQTNVTTNGGTDGSASVTVSGGSSPYTYSWNTNPAQTTASATGLTAGTYQVTVTDAANCTKTHTFTITQPALSNNADLSNMILNSSTLSPLFSPTTLSYTATVPNSTTSVTITPTKADVNASIKVNGVTVASGNTSSPINLNVGNNSISTEVTAQDGITTKTYTIVITRTGSNNANLSGLTLSSGTLDPSFTPTTTNYSASVPNPVSSISLTPIVAEANATILINGVSTSSGNPSAPIQLNVGVNTITIIVTAQDGTINTYTVLVTRDISTGTKEESNSKSVMVYPNPNNGSFLIQLNELEPGKTTLNIYDVLGKEILVKILHLNSTSFSENLVIPDVKGIYVLKIATGGQYIIKKVIVE